MCRRACLVSFLHLVHGIKASVLSGALLSLDTEPQPYFFSSDVTSPCTCFTALQDALAVSAVSENKFFFLRFGRNCTRRFLQLRKQKTSNKATRKLQQQSDPQTPQPDLRFAANQTAKQHRNGARPNYNNHTGFAK